MKKLLLSCFAFFMLSITVFAQSPQKINYQGIARDLKGNPIPNQKINIKLQIIPNIESTFIEYAENQSIETNNFGLYTLQIGNGDVETGNFSNIKWETGTKYIKVFIDAKGGNHYEEIGTTQLLSVPYALYANKAGTANELAETKKTRTGTVSSATAHAAGDANYVSKFTAFNTIGKSLIYDNGVRVGIGTTSPLTSGLLHLKSVSGTQPLILESPQGVHNLIQENGLNRGYFGSYIGSGTPYPSPTGTSDADFDIGTSNANPTGKLHLATRTTPRLTIDNTGLVGIGTTSPTTKFQVIGSELTTGLFVSAGVDNTTGILKSEYTGTTLDDHIAIYGKSQPSLSENYGIGLYGEGGFVGIRSFAKNTNVGTVYGGVNEASSRGETFGVLGSAQLDIAGNLGTKIGVMGYARGGVVNIGVYGTADTTGAFADTYAGYFNGDVGVNGDLVVTGNIAKGGGTFKIDHPLDPENKYLYHSFVESPDMMNIYNGNAVTDANGVVIVKLPEYFEALNKDFRYQLTAIGGPAQVWIQQEVSNNQFTIQSSVANAKVSWQVTGIRKDDYANAHRVVAEVDKRAADKGKYLYPLEAGKKIENGIEFKNIVNPNIRK